MLIDYRASDLIMCKNYWKKARKFSKITSFKIHTHIRKPLICDILICDIPLTQTESSVIEKYTKHKEYTR